MATLSVVGIFESGSPDLDRTTVENLHHDWTKNLSLDAGVQVGLGPHSTEYGGLYSFHLDTHLAPGRTIWARVARYF